MQRTASNLYVLSVIDVREANNGILAIGMTLATVQHFAHLSYDIEYVLSTEAGAATIDIAGLRVSSRIAKGSAVAELTLHVPDNGDYYMNIRNRNSSSQFVISIHEGILHSAKQTSGDSLINFVWSGGTIGS